MKKALKAAINEVMKCDFNLKFKKKERETACAHEQE